MISAGFSSIMVAGYSKTKDIRTTGILLQLIIKDQMGKLPLLKISANRRYLLTADDSPFFWLGDTAWELFHRLSIEDASVYLKDRSSKGFNVIQAVLLAELDGLDTPNAYGERPLQDNDPAQPREAYFK